MWGESGHSAVLQGWSVPPYWDSFWVFFHSHSLCMWVFIMERLLHGREAGSEHRAFCSVSAHNEISCASGLAKSPATWCFIVTYEVSYEISPNHFLCWNVLLTLTLHIKPVCFSGGTQASQPHYQIQHGRLYGVICLFLKRTGSMYIYMWRILGPVEGVNWVVIAIQ